jgi:hypothetical protein
MSSEASLHAEQDNATAAVTAVSVATDSSHPTVPLFGTSSDGTPSAREQQLIAQVQLMQQRIDQLERQAQAPATARPSAGTCVTAASSPIRAAGISCSHCGQLQLPPPRSSKGQQLHRDALHCVFAFLSLTELPAAMRSCRAWYMAVRSLPLRNDSFFVQNSWQLREMTLFASNSLIRHVVKCDVLDAYTADELAPFLACLPRLRSLTHWACSSTEMHPQLYSNQLRELHVNLWKDRSDDSEEGGDGNEEDAVSYDALVAQMENLSSAGGLRSLTLTLPHKRDRARQVSLKPLECLKKLESLKLSNGYMLPPSQLVHVRRLPSLRLLFLDGGWSQERMEVLVDEKAGDRADLNCPQLQLRWLDLGHAVINLKQAQLLLRIPTLQWLEPDLIMPDALHLLAHGLPDLHTLKAEMHGMRSVIDGWTVVRDSLAACCQLTDLTLKCTPLEELAALFLALPPSLRKLNLRSYGDLLRSDVLFQCVAKGGLRQVHQLRIQSWQPQDKYEAHEVAAWRTRMVECAPWINALVDT